MLVTLAEIKGYLHVDYADDDQLLGTILSTAEKLCMDVFRAETETEFNANATSKIAVMYAAAYLYEHREEADHNSLNITLRAMLGDRKEEF